MKFGSTILFLTICVVSGYSQMATTNATGYVYLKPLDCQQKVYESLEKIVYFKIFVDNELVVASNNVENLQNYIPVDSYNEWSLKRRREVKMVFTLNDGSEIQTVTVKETSSLLTQNIYFLN